MVFNDQDLTRRLALRNQFKNPSKIFSFNCINLLDTSKNEVTNSVVDCMKLQCPDYPPGNYGSRSATSQKPRIDQRFRKPKPETTPMNSFIKTLAFCAMLGASGGANAAPVLFPNGNFASAPTRGTWAEEFGGLPGETTTFSYPTTGGSGGSGGYGVMNNSGGWGIWVNSNNAFFTSAEMSSLGLTPGNGYTFFMDMKIETGAPNNILGRIKFEWAGVGGGTEEFVRTLIGDGTTWQRYTYNVVIPAGATGLKVVPVISSNAKVGFDNIGFESVPYFVAPTPPPPPPVPTDVVLNEKFDVASPNWQAITGPSASRGSLTWTNAEGNPPGATTLAVASGNAPGDVFFTYTATGVNFGDGPIEISFDGKLLSALPGTAIHVLYNGNFVGAIMNSLNQATYTKVTRTFNLNQGFSPTTTFTLTFQFAMGAVAGNGGSVSIDNIVVKTNLPSSAPPTTAQIKQGVEVAWVAGNSAASYQPQESTVSASGPWANLGSPISGISRSTEFDSTPSPFYQVVENVPAVFSNLVFNPGFEANPVAPADGWSSLVELGGGTVSISQSFPGGYLPQSGTNMLVLRAQTAAAAPAESAIAEARTISSEPLPEFGETTIPVKVGTTYNFSFYALNALKSDSTDAQYTFFIYDEFGNVIETPIIGNFSIVGNTWTKVETTLTIPETLGGVSVGSPGDDAGVVIAFRLATGPINALDWVALIDTVSFSTGGPISPAQTNILAATKAPAVEVSWKTVTGRDYQVESSTTLLGWGDFGSSVAGDGSIFSITDLITAPKKFFRVLETTP
ncbi:MAG: hypothetical protein ACRDBP_13595 [Luteolibacter sp.]